MRLPKLTLAIKIPLIYILISAISLIIMNLSWYYFSHTQTNANELLSQGYAAKITIIAIVVFLFTLVLVTVLSIWLILRIIEPIEELQKGFKIISAGNFSKRVSINTGDEIEDLANSFNIMSANLQHAFNNLEYDKSIIAAERNKIAITISHIKDIVIAVDLHKRIVIFNKASERITGFSADEAIGKLITEVFKLYQLDESKKYIEISDDNYCPIPTEPHEGTVFSAVNVKLISSKDKESHVNVEVGQIKEGLTTGLGCILTIHDITQERELEDMKVDFVSMAAHELRTPITALRGYSEILKEEISDKLGPTQKHFLERISNSITNLSNLVDNLLNASRIEKGTLKLDLRINHVEDITKAAIQELQQIAKNKNQSLIWFNPHESFPPVIVDKFRIDE
ncbi:MAG TPA: histidine kinase dimerization/phospho-acceptor domain-containing protein, partial [Xanthomonadales bacterium]|nr:histidine kinase dimerization/phospho-acceptor domain-containing protein [Xanthomonadales bacterium]